MSHIEALSLQAYSWGMSTDLLNPSSYKLRKVDDKGSLLSSTRDIELFSREKVEDSAWLSYGKPVRAVARTLYTIAVSMLVAPVGLAYHATGAIIHSFMMLKGDDAEQEDATQESWQKVKQHTAAFFRDLIVGFTGILGVAYIAVGVTISPFYVLPGALLNLKPIANGLWPRFMAEHWHMREQKAHVFRDEFGLVNRNGGLLTVDRDEDQEDSQLNGQLGQLWQNRCQKLLEAVHALQHDAAEQNNIPFVYPPNGKAIGRNMPQDVNLKVGAGPVSAKAHLKSLQKEINVAQDALKECLETQHEGKKRKYFVKLPAFPIKRAEAETYFVKQ